MTIKPPAKWVLEFSTFDVVDILGVKRHTLQQWIEKDFIVPSRGKASGVGSKSLFSLEDVYRVKVFAYLAKAGVPREHAKFHSQDTNFKKKYQYIKPIKEDLLKWTSICSDKEDVDVANEVFLIVLNLDMIKRSVDEKVRKFKGM